MIFFFTIWSFPHFFAMWEPQYSWGNGALQPNWHSLECGPLLSFCQHHRCMSSANQDIWQTGNWWDVDFSNIRPLLLTSLCPWLRFNTQTYTQEKKCQNSVPWSRSLLPAIFFFLALDQQKKKDNKRNYSQRLRGTTDWVSVCCPAANLTLKYWLASDSTSLACFKEVGGDSSY